MRSKLAVTGWKHVVSAQQPRYTWGVDTMTAPDRAKRCPMVIWASPAACFSNQQYVTTAGGSNVEANTILTCAWRHINDQDIQLAPVHIADEGFERAHDHWASPRRSSILLCRLPSASTRLTQTCWWQTYLHSPPITYAGFSAVQLADAAMHGDDDLHP